MKKKTVSLFLIVSFAFSTLAQNKDAILGKWLNASGEGQILIYKKGEHYFGKLIWLKKPDDEKGNVKLDNKNPNSSFKSRPLLGLELLKDFTYEGDGIWEDGSIYDPKTGKTYSCKMSMISSDKLDIRGYVGISLLGRTETWTRVRE